MRCSSKFIALLDYYRVHLPNHREPPHYLTVIPGEIYAETWHCSCGEEGDPAGYTAPIRVQQSHSVHTNRALLAHYESIVKRSMAGWTEQQRHEHRRQIALDAERQREASIARAREDAKRRALNDLL
jgi:hypothetical protein